MSQKRFINYKGPITSFEANEKYTGILEPTVYRGFDAIQNQTGLTFTLSHALTGEYFTGKDQNLTPPRGVWVTRQGIVVKEDGVIEFTTTAHVGLLPRFDLLVGEHEYDELSSGGLPATYKVLTGTTSAPPLPSENQTPIGVLTVNSNGTLQYTRVRTPQLGGKFAAILNEDNRFTHRVSLNHATANVVSTDYQLEDRATILALGTANTYRVTNPTGFLDLVVEEPAGTEINLIFENDTVIRQREAQLDGSVVSGNQAKMRAIIISFEYPLRTLPVKAGESVTMVRTVMPGTTEPVWLVTSVSTSAAVLGKLREDVTSHISNEDNPHEVTKEQVGLGNIPNIFVDAPEDMTSVPGVVGTGLLEGVMDDLGDTASTLSSHIGNTSNPHAVTKTQVGLGNIPNLISDSINQDNSNSLATSKAVYLLNQAILTQQHEAFAPTVTFLSGSDSAGLIYGRIIRTGKQIIVNIRVTITPSPSRTVAGTTAFVVTDFPSWVTYINPAWIGNVTTRNPSNSANKNTSAIAFWELNGGVMRLSVSNLWIEHDQACLVSINIAGWIEPLPG